MPTFNISYKIGNREIHSETILMRHLAAAKRSAATYSYSKEVDIYIRDIIEMPLAERKEGKWTTFTSEET